MVVVKEMFMEPVVEESVEDMKVENLRLNIIKMDSLIMPLLLNGREDNLPKFTGNRGLLTAVAMPIACARCQKKVSLV